ncbi:hypothetical protein C8Q78DRAFT_1080705 [Trametes maxima]|nr:hypothetical protein C8Q78DRAFT_1080705 [Trametes maxima]
MAQDTSGPRSTPAKSQDNSWAFTPGGRFADPFPIIFKLPSEELADEVLTYRDTIKLIERADSMVDRVRLVFTLLVGDEILEDHGLYVVAYGNASGVYYEHKDTVSAAKGVPAAIWKKVPDFRRAVVFMVSGGQSEKPVERDVEVELNGLLSDYITSRAAAGCSTPLRVGTGFASAPLSRAPPPTPMSPTPMYAHALVPTPSPLRTHPGSMRRPLAEPSFSGTTRAESPTLAPRSSSPFRSLMPLLRERVFERSLAEVRVDTNLAYQHTQNLRGIKGVHSHPQVNTMKALSCGQSLDMFLQAFGYDTSSKLVVAYACHSSDTMEDFVRDLMSQGLPMLEAKYMWILYETDPPTRTWAETHVM